MPQPIVQQFMGALQAMERTRDAGGIVDLFAADADLVSPARELRVRGRQGAERFWRDYLDAFDRVETDFTRTLEGDGFAVLEWSSSFTADGDGRERQYDGVSIVEFNGDHVTGFRTYYDSAAFTPQGAGHVT